MSMLRHFSIEAMASALAPKVQHWHRGDQRRIPMADAAMAIAGVDRTPRAFLLLSWGLGGDEDRAVCTRHLMGCAGWEAEAEQWPAGRLARMVEMVLDEIGHAKPTSEIERARELGVCERTWHRAWKGRYQRILGDALEQVSRSHRAMARRVGGDQSPE